MAEAKKSPSASIPPEDALPIKKTSTTTYIVGGVGAMVVLALIIGMTGGDKEAQKEKAEESAKAADAEQGMTKEEREERQAHLMKTQAALIAANAEEEAEANKKKAAAQEATQAEEAKPTATASKGSSAPAPKPVNKKKTIDSLDGLGSDITSALK